MKKSPAEEKQGQSVEDIFRGGFAGAEDTPPPRIWENVTRELENQELHHYRQQVKWYRALAAAFLVLLLSAGVVLWKQNTQGDLQNGAVLASKATGEAKGAGAGINSSTAENLKKPTRRIEAERMASVSGPGLEKEVQNQSGSSEERILNEERSSQKRGEAALVRSSALLPVLIPSNGEMAVVKKDENGVPTKETVSERSDGGLPGNGEGNRPISRAIVNSMVASKSIPLTGDSLGEAPPRSILVQKQKESEAAILAQAQPAEKEPVADEAAAQRWSITMKYNPQYAYSPLTIQEEPGMSDHLSLSQPQVYHQYQQAVDEYKNSYSPAFSFSTMVGASYKLNDKWQFESGLLYAQNEATTTHSYLIYTGGVFAGGNASGFSNKSTPIVANALDRNVEAASGSATLLSRTTQYNIRYKYQQLGLPLRVAYRLNSNKLYAFISGGLNLNVLLQNSILPESDQVEPIRYSFNEEGSPFNTLHVASSTSVGVGYDVSKKMSILVAPEFTYSLTPMVRDGQQQPNAYQLGVAIGGKWRLTK